jgi:hypothetical protein
MDNAVYDRIIGEISKIGKLISVSTVLKRFKVNGSIVYGLIKDLNKSDQLWYAEVHSRKALIILSASYKKVEEITTKATDVKDVKEVTKKDINSDQYLKIKAMSL